MNVDLFHCPVSIYLGFITQRFSLWMMTCVIVLFTSLELSEKTTRGEKGFFETHSTSPCPNPTECVITVEYPRVQNGRAGFFHTAYSPQNRREPKHSLTTCPGAFFASRRVETPALQLLLDCCLSALSRGTGERRAGQVKESFLRKVYNDDT